MRSLDFRCGLRLSLGLGIWFLGLGTARAGDLAEALTFAQGVMGEEIVEGYEDFVDYDPTEALPLLLSRDVQPTHADPSIDRDHFSTLGASRLSFAELRPHMTRAAEATGLPVALIDAVIRTESGYRPNAVSRTGAQGLMQLMPDTAKEVGVSDAFDPGQNIMGGARYLRKLYDRFGTLEMAVAAYNAGPGAVARHHGVPPYKETRRYVATVIDRYRNPSVR